MASICKVGRDPQIPLMKDGVEGLPRLGGIADSLLLRRDSAVGDVSTRLGPTSMTSPIILTEDGADIVTIFHAVSPRYGPRNLRKCPSTCATRVFDRVEVIVGEHVWSFADVATGPAAFRVDGTKQGVFMRDRRPKAKAHLLQRRWRPEP